MKERLREIREKHPHGKTQDTFADYLGISKSNLASYEVGRRSPSEAVVKLICQKCNINEEWLRNGTGEMHKSLTPNQEVAQFVNEIMSEADESFRKRLIVVLSKLNPEQWKLLADIAQQLNEPSETENEND